MQADFASWRARISPLRVAFTANSETYTYAEANDRAQRAVTVLNNLNVSVGDRVALIAHNNIAHFDLMAAAAKAGFIANPFNTRLSPVELGTLIAKMQPRVVLFDEAHAHIANQLREYCDATFLSLTAYEIVLQAAQPTTHTVQIEEDTPHMMLFTGGTTGLPKGALLPHRQTFYNAVNTVFAWGLGPDDAAIQATPAFHAAVNAVSLPLLHAGGRVILQEAFDPAEYLRLVETEKPTILFLVPTMYAMLAQQPAFASTDFSSVRWAISGGAACPEPLAKRFRARGIRFRQGYGLTEVGVNCFSIEQDEADEHPDAVGHPMPFSEMRIVTSTGADAGPGEVGELFIRGPHVFLGYYDEPEETALALQDDGWLATGDFAMADETGLYTIAGRKKEMFISGGENVFPNEIEAALFDHPAVQECAVVPIPDPTWGEVGSAHVVVASSIAEDELRDFLRERLARYKVPKQFVFHKALPKSAAGKILKQQLRKEHV